MFCGKRADGVALQTLTGFSSSSLRFTYLGAPISKGRKKAFLLGPLIDKIKKKKLSGWNLNQISQGGRYVLIKSVLSSLPVYLLQVLNPPLSVFKAIETLMARCLWGSSDSSKKIHWTNWSKISKPYGEGGLNIKSLKDMSTAFASKL